MNTQQLLDQAQAGFAQVKIAPQYQTAALQNLQTWLIDPQFSPYVPQITALISNQAFDYLLDCFYQVIPFGTGGRRGEVGIGPNRLNPYTIQSSAQGHSQYLLAKYGDQAKTRGVVLCYDVRQFTGNKFIDNSVTSPITNITSRQFAQKAAEVYAANGIQSFIFDDVRTTPELSFAIRHLHAVAGDMISASHNPPEHNGKKVYDEFGGQLTPPFDEELVNEVTQNVTEIKIMAYDQAVQAGLIQTIGATVDEAYLQTLADLSLSDARDVKIAYTPLHGTGTTSLYPLLKKLNFDVNLDPATANPSGAFENVTFHNPNPEVIQSFDTVKKYADQIKADIILSTDPDADRIGIMVKHHDQWQFVNGNEIGAILSEYVITKKKSQLNPKSIIIKTDVTTNLIAKIAADNQVRIKGDLLVGFKYIGEEMNRLETAGEINDFLLGTEESHGYIFGNYARDKDAAPAGLYLAELAAELKQNGQTIIDYLEAIYAKYGYYLNYLTEIRLPGAEGMGQIQQIIQNFRQAPPQTFGQFQVEKVVDFLDRKPIVSATDEASKNALGFHFVPTADYASMRVTVRPSGTEPKIKMYFEIGSHTFAPTDLPQVQAQIEQVKVALEKAFMIASYQQIGINFPERGFLLFWQLPLPDKMKYFEIEPQIVALKTIADPAARQAQLDQLLAFLGSDPIMKVNEAFKAEYQTDLLAYLDLA